MNIGDWKYYNHAVVPSVEPHETPDISCIKDRSIWKGEGGGQDADSRTMDNRL